MVRESFSQALTRYFEDAGLPLNSRQADQFTGYKELLVEYNKKVNLTAITDDAGIAEKHFLDSGLILKHIDIKKGAKIADIGTGAGFPGIPLKILRPDLELTLIDSLNKRILFLKQLMSTCGLSANAVHMRGEEAGRLPVYREEFALVTARAVAALPALTEVCLPLVAVGGRFVAMKGTLETVKRELESAENAVKILGGEVEDMISYHLPSDDERTLVVVKKISQTPPKYPRQGVKISKQPLK